MSQHKKEVEKQKEIESNIAPKKEAKSKESLSLNSESEGFGTEEHIADIKKRQAEKSEVSADEERLLSQQV